MWLLISILISAGTFSHYSYADQNYNFSIYNETFRLAEPCIIQSNLNSQINTEPLISSSVIYGLLTMASSEYLSGTCLEEMISIYDGIRRKDVWAMKLLDSSAHNQPGFVWGNNFWMGSIKGCKAIRRPIPLTLSNRFPRDMKPHLPQALAPFDVDYRVVYAKHRSPWQIQVEFFLSDKILHIGLCLPTSCSDEEIVNITQTYFDRNLISSQSVYEYHPSVVLVKDLNIKSNFFAKTSVKIVGYFVLMTVILFTVSAAYDHKRKLEFSTLISGKEANNNIPQRRTSQYNNDLLTFAKKFHLSQTVDNNTKSTDQDVFVERSTLGQILSCFSFSDNFSSIVSTETSAKSIPVVNGMKSIGCFLILIFHMNWFSHFTVHNPAMMFSYGEQLLWQWVSTTPIIVDVFFTVSGLLLSYNFLKNQNQIDVIKENDFWKNCKLFSRQLLHRYMRLSPLYLLLTCVTEITTSYLVETSPFWVHERYDQMCQNYWWRNVFYIQNMFDVKELCLNWTWSMACEMQFFIIFTVLLFLYIKNPNLAKKIYLAMFIGFSLFIFYVAMTVKFTPAYDVMHNLGQSLYISPWTRILPYLIGVGAGWLLHNLNGNISLNQKTIKLVWALAATTAIMCHLSTIDRSLSYYYAAPLITAIRISYSLSIAWMIVASTLGHGGLFAKFMNLSAFVHVNKLSYGIYLLNPLVISVIYGSKDHSTHIDPITLTIMSIGVMVVVYVISFIFSLLFEVPYTKLSSIMLKVQKIKTN